MCNKEILKINMNININSEVKYIYYLMTREFLFTEKIDKKLPEIAKQLLIPKRDFSSALSILINEKLITIDGKHSGKGRPSYIYKINGRIHDAERNSKLDNQPYIDELLSLNSDTKKHVGLKNANRLLLITLFANANKFGIVDSISKKKLMALTNMSKDRLKSQLKKLLSLGYINYMIQGTSGKHLLGVVKGYYSLNLLSNLYSINIIYPTAILFNSGLYLGDFNLNQPRKFNWISDLISIHARCFDCISKTSKKRLYKRELTEYFLVNEHLILPLRQAIKLSVFTFENSIISFVILRILKVSSYLLTTNYDSLSKDHKDEYIIKSLKVESFSKGTLNELNRIKGAGDITQTHVNELIELYYSIGLSFAMLIKESLGIVEGIDFAQVNFHIHPANIKTAAFVVYISSEDIVIKSKYICLKIQSRAITSKKNNTCELLDKLDFSLQGFFIPRSFKKVNFDWKINRLN